MKFTKTIRDVEGGAEARYPETPARYFALWRSDVPRSAGASQASGLLRPVRFVTLIYAYLRMSIGGDQNEVLPVDPEKNLFAGQNREVVVGMPGEFGFFGFRNGLGKRDFTGESGKKIGLFSFYRFSIGRWKPNWLEGVENGGGGCEDFTDVLSITDWLP